MDQQLSPDLTVVVCAHDEGGLGGGGVGALSTHSTCHMPVPSEPSLSRW